MLKSAAVARFLSLAWCATLIGLMASGSFSSARIGTMTWGPEHDIWSATIAISQINFGLSGKLGFKEVEQAIANEVISTKNVWRIMDEKTQSLLRDPEAVMRGLKAAAAVHIQDISVPPTNQGYLTNWCEDLGYADFYNIAFRLFGFSAFSTHWLYVSIISSSFILFTITFFRENLAIASLTLGVSALFLASSSIFSELMPSFAANRFLSTLALIPLLHLIHTILRVGPLRWAEIGVLIGQILIVSFAISARSSAQWCLFALVFSSVAVVLMRSRTGVPRLNGQDIRRFAARLAATPCVGRIGTSAAIVLVVTVGVDVVRNLQFDARYFRDDNLPRHLFWHSAYLGLYLNPEWPAFKPYPDVPNGGDFMGFKVFEHRMSEWELPFASTHHQLYWDHYYRARVYERVIRNEYIKFVLKNPIYVIELFAYYKPKKLIGLISVLCGAISYSSYVLAIVSLTLLTILFTLSEETWWCGERGVCFGVVWLCSLLPVLWAYPVSYVLADQVWSTLFLLMAVISLSAAALARALSARLVRLA
jgi:hypothetical protein